MVELAGVTAERQSFDDMPAKFTEDQVAAILKQAETGRKVAVLCREHGVSEQTFYRWKARYAPGAQSFKRLRDLEDENLRLKQLVADQALQLHALREHANETNSPRKAESKARNARRGGTAE
jgi:putative transposase